MVAMARGDIRRAAGSKSCRGPARPTLPPSAASREAARRQQQRPLRWLPQARRWLRRSYWRGCFHALLLLLLLSPARKQWRRQAQRTQHRRPACRPGHPEPCASVPAERPPASCAVSVRRRTACAPCERAACKARCGPPSQKRRPRLRPARQMHGIGGQLRPWMPEAEQRQHCSQSVRLSSRCRTWSMRLKWSCHAWGPLIR